MASARTIVGRSAVVMVDTAALLRLSNGIEVTPYFGERTARAYYRAIENGYTTMRTLDRIACALGVHPYELADGDIFEEVR